MGKVRDEEEAKARRNIMWMQMFNYDRTNRDSAQRPIEMSAAVAGGSKSISSKKAIIIGVVGTILAVVLVYIFSYFWNKGRDIPYTSLFDYAVDYDWQSEEEVFSPEQAAFGMSTKEILQSQELSDVIMWNEDKQKIIFDTQELTNLSETIEEAIFNKVFVIVEEVGLVEVIYQLVINDTDLDEMREMLYEQSVSYMPSPDVPWNDMEQQVVEWTWTQYEKNDTAKQNPKSIVRVYFDQETYEDETVISLSVYTPRALTDSYLDRLDD